MVLNWGHEDFEEALDPKLSALAPLLVSLATQVRPEYGYLDKNLLAEDHVHEVFRWVYFNTSLI